MVPVYERDDDRVEKLAYSLDDEIRNRVGKAIGIIALTHMALVLIVSIAYDQDNFGPVPGILFGFIPIVVGCWFTIKKRTALKVLATATIALWLILGWYRNASNM